jgi:membrane fusion protein (multidrug efflux system)
LANLDATRRLQQSVIDQAEADIAAAAAELVRARYDFDRYRTLSNDKFAPLQRFQQADADHEKALAAARKARAGWKPPSAVSMSSIRRKSRSGPLWIRRWRSATWRRSTSPIRKSGRRSTESSATAALAREPTRRSGFSSWRSSRPVALWVDANFKESQLAHMREGQIVRIAADVLPGVRFEGHVGSLAPATGAQFSVIPPENATGNFTKIVQRVPVRIVLDDDASELGKLRPGLSVVVQVDERPAHTDRIHIGRK